MKFYQYNNKRSQIYRRYTSGFTLVELMVAVTLGLILSTAVTVMYIGTSDVFRVQAQYAQAQQNGRYAINVLNRTIRQAGFCGSPTGLGCAFPPANSLLTVLSIQGFLPATPPPTIPGASAPRTGAIALTVLNGDALRVAFYGTADRSVLDCLGRVVPANALAVNTFRVAPEDAGTTPAGVPAIVPPALFCHSAFFTVDNTAVAPAASTTPIPGTNQEDVIAPGISRLALAYMVANQIRDGTTNAPVQPNSFQVVRNFPPTVAGTAPNTDRDRVVAVRISLVSLTGAQATQGRRTENLSLLAPPGHPLAENIGLGGNAGQGVRIYSSTVALRNRLAFVN